MNLNSTFRAPERWHILERSLLLQGAWSEGGPRGKELSHLLWREAQAGPGWPLSLND